MNAFMPRCFLILITAVAAPLAAQLDRIPPPSATSPLARNAASVEAGQRRFRQNSGLAWVTTTSFGAANHEF